MNFTLTPKQIEATKLHEKYRHVLLYGGARSGKNFVCIHSIITRALETRSDHLVVGKSLKSDTLPRVIELRFPDMEYQMNLTDSRLDFKNGSTVWFRGLDIRGVTEGFAAEHFSTIMFPQCDRIKLHEANNITVRLKKQGGLAMYTCRQRESRHWTYTAFDKTQPIPVEDIFVLECTILGCLNPSYNLNAASLEFQDYSKGGS